MEDDPVMPTDGSEQDLAPLQVHLLTQLMGY